MPTFRIYKTIDVEITTASANTLFDAYHVLGTSCNVPTVADLAEAGYTVTQFPEPADVGTVRRVDRVLIGCDDTGWFRVDDGWRFKGWPGILPDPLSGVSLESARRAVRFRRGQEVDTAGLVSMINAFELGPTVSAGVVNYVDSGQMVRVTLDGRSPCKLGALAGWADVLTVMKMVIGTSSRQDECEQLTVHGFIVGRVPCIVVVDFHRNREVGYIDAIHGCIERRDLGELVRTLFEVQREGGVFRGSLA